MKVQTADRLFAAFVIGSGAFLFYLIALLVVMAPTSDECARAGYVDGRVTYDFDRYCIVEVDETDYIVPFDEAMETHARDWARPPQGDPDA